MHPGGSRVALADRRHSFCFTEGTEEMTFKREKEEVGRKRTGKRRRKGRKGRETKEEGKRDRERGCLG